MFNYLKGVLDELNRSIFDGERYERNMRGISVGALLIIVINLITGSLNLINHYSSAALASGMFITAGLLILYFTRLKKNRTAAVLTALVSVIVIFTYEIFSVAHGFPIFWTLLLPLAFCYLADVKLGIYLSLYFMLLYLILFCTPLRYSLGAHFSDIIAQRFPILYLGDVILTAYIMVQYHRITLYQADNARQLLEAKEAADRANAAKSDFLGEMSHEIRTPINAVLGMNEMILRESVLAREDSSPDRQTAALNNISIYAGNVESAGNNLLSIINDILDFSKIEAGRMDIVPSSYKLSSVLNDVSNTILFRARDKGLDFLTDVEESIPDELYGDRVRIRQIITNLLTNAVKYTDQGSIRLKVLGEAESVESGEPIVLKISVSDTGTGIREEDIGELFAKFRRVDLKRNSTVEGTGLGLAITQSLLSMMGGEIHVESVYGAGSTFTAVIPQKIISPEAIGEFGSKFKNTVSASKIYEGTFRAPDARILIVDDTRMNLTVATELLKKTDITADTALSGQQAINLTLTTRYDLILMDQRMPGMDGTEALHCIREQQDGANPDTPIICLTADAVIGAKEKYLSEGFTDYLTKPIDNQELEQILIKYLPDEKVIPPANPGETAAGDGKPEARERKEDLDLLREKGLDPSVGLSYCLEDETIYRSLLEEYACKAEEKVRAMKDYKEKGDLHNLAVLSHAVKSTSEMIGAGELSDIAADIEKAADGGNLAAVDRNFDRLITQYEEVVSAIRLINPSGDRPLSSDDDEIMEFLPE